MTGCSHLYYWNKQHLKDLRWTKNMKCNKAGSMMKIVISRLYNLKHFILMNIFEMPKIRLDLTI